MEKYTLINVNFLNGPQLLPKIELESEGEISSIATKIEDNNTFACK